MQVPTLDLKAQYNPLRAEIDAAIKDVLDNTAFILGPRVKTFENNAAAYCKVPYALGVSSGTDALLVALMNEGIGHGDEVITTGFTFFATAGTIARTGATPVFADIDPVTFNIDPAKIEEKITPRTRAIMPVHLYGQAADMTAIMAIAEKHNLIVIEDAAQAIGTEHKGQRVGTFGRYGCLSFFPSKNLGATGDAGMVITNDKETYTKLARMRTHGECERYIHQYVGGNFRLDSLHAAVLNVKLPHLDSWTEARQANANTYRKLFAKTNLVLDEAPGNDLIGKVGIILPKEIEDGRHIYNQFVLRTDRRDELLKFLNDHGIGARVYYPVPLNKQDCFKVNGEEPCELPQAELAAKQVLALPIFGELTQEQLEYVVSTVAEFFGK